MDDRTSPIAAWWWAAILAGVFACEVWAQAPAPPVDPAVAGAPAPSGDPSAPVCTRRGRLHRMFHHTAHTVQDDFIGDPQTFVEPPLGSYINRQFATQVSKADPHRFTIYHTDFLPDSDRFSPIGASRFNLMYTRLAGWSGPIFVEWTPDQPELAESRRQAILATLAAAGSPIPAERVLVGPPLNPGASGVDAINNYNNMVGRGQSAALTFPLPPAFSSTMGIR
jgi:hypothetical protein